MSNKRTPEQRADGVVEPKEETVGLSRARFLGLGAAMGGAAALVACGGGSPAEETTAAPGTEAAEDTPSPDAGETGEDAGEGASAEEIVPASEVPVGESYEFRDGGEPAVLVHVSEGEFVAYSAVCTHQGCTVTYGGTELSCPCHGSTFDLSDGAPTNGPATEPLPEISVSVEGDSVVRA